MRIEIKTVTRFGIETTIGSQGPRVPWVERVFKARSKTRRKTLRRFGTRMGNRE